MTIKVVCLDIHNILMGLSHVSTSFCDPKSSSGNVYLLAAAQKIRIILLRLNK